MVRSTFCFVVLAAVLATSAVARADEGDGSIDARPRLSKWRFGVGTSARWFGDPSAASLTTKRMFMPQLTAARRLLVTSGPLDGLTLSAITRVAGGSSEGMLFQTLDTRIEELAITGGARLELAVWKQIFATAQLDLGAARTTVVIGDSLEAMAPVDDSVWHFIATGWLGVEIAVMMKGRFSLSFDAEVGYTVTQGAEIHATPRSHPEPELSIPTVYAALGDLDTRGLATQMSIRFGF